MICELHRLYEEYNKQAYNVPFEASLLSVIFPYQSKKNYVIYDTITQHYVKKVFINSPKRHGGGIVVGINNLARNERTGVRRFKHGNQKTVSACEGYEEMLPIS